MKIEHLAIWVQDLENMRKFYLTYFDTRSGEKYLNPKTQFASYFISFGENNARIELMTRPGIISEGQKSQLSTGLAHFALSVGTKENVHALTERLRTDGYIIFSEPSMMDPVYRTDIVES